MRKVLLVLLCVVCILSVSAQEKKTQKEYAISPTIEATGSFNTALYNKEIKNSYDMQKKVLYTVGALFGFDYALPHGALMFQTGILVGNNDYVYGAGRWMFKAISLDIPFIIGYAYRINSNYSISFSAGYVMKNLVKNTIAYNYGLNDPFPKKLNHGIYGAIGFAYQASPLLTLRVEPFFEYIFKRETTVQEFNLFAENISAPIIGLRIALKFNILKLKQ